ncbi:MAG: nucleotidyl transferase AbiEii/AbiGii toxin family protein [Caulobacteraceae bacterium]
MAFRDVYRQQASLLIRILPLVAEEPDFALKGGTAINFFVRDMPRLSVDIDLAFLPVTPRPEALGAIDAAMKRIAERIRQGLRGSRVNEGMLRPEGVVTKLIARLDGVQIKIEITPVLRGSVFPAEERTVTAAVESELGFAEIKVLSFADLYAGKLVAALDRQHPRDLFDVRDLLANEGVRDRLRQAFIAYIISHDRPMAEVLAPTRKDITQAFEREFQGMTAVAVSLDELLAVREALIEAIVGRMPEAHRRFLMQFERGEPEWTLLGAPGVADLPAVRWRRRNLDSLTAERRAALVDALGKALEMGPADGSASVRHQS